VLKTEGQSLGDPVPQTFVTPGGSVNVCPWETLKSFHL
jgi:hypothetical protein